MAKKLDNTEIKMGNLIKVANQDRKPSESEIYYAVKLQDVDDSEFWCLFTAAEVLSLRHCVLLDGTKPKKGHLFCKHRLGKCTRSFVLLGLPAPSTNQDDVVVTGDELVVALSDKLIARGKARATANPEDVPKMSWLKDILD